MASAIVRPEYYAPSPQTREYLAAQSIVFLKTKEAFGGLSNMAAGYPLQMNGIAIRSSEALYQACRFPHLPEVQQRIISQTSPMTAKMVSKPFRAQSRADWEQIKVNVMRWCLRVKLAQNRKTFGTLLLETGDLAIVEKSFKDSYWGAKPSTDGSVLIGMNVLGRLLMELREELRSGAFDQREFIQPLKVVDFCLYGQWIAPIAVGSSGSVNVKKSVSMESLSLPMEQGVVEPVVSTPSLVAGLKPYVEYKETGIAWIKRIPAHWQILRIKLLLQEQDKRSKTGKEQLLKVSQYTGVTKRNSIEEEPDTRAKSLVGYKQVALNDLVINIMLAWNGSLGISKYAGIVSPAYCVYRFNKTINPEYYHYLLRTPLYKGRIKAASTGVVESRLRLYSDQLGRIEGLVPPLDEQDNIVAFINYANHKIDQYIRAKKKLIKLLNEQKQVIIHKAVTRGLNPQVKLKDSGIEWLGEIPEHWSTISLGAATKLIQTGPFGSQLHFQDYIINGTPIINPSHIKDHKIEPDQTTTVNSKKLTELKRHQLKINDVIAARRGELGRCAVVTGKEKGWLCGTGSLIIRCNESILIPLYFQKIFSSQGVVDHLNLSSVGSTMANLNANIIAQLKIPLPSPSEQVAINNHIDEINLKHAQKTKNILNEIKLMQEYRTRLISDVVTGQLDVQTAVQQLPQLNILNSELINTLDEAEDLTDDEAELIPEDQTDGDGYQ